VLVANEMRMVTPEVPVVLERYLLAALLAAVLELLDRGFPVAAATRQYQVEVAVAVAVVLVLQEPTER
jgi:hypothetical protein